MLLLYTGSQSEPGQTSVSLRTFKSLHRLTHIFQTFSYPICGQKHIDLKMLCFWWCLKLNKNNSWGRAVSNRAPLPWNRFPLFKGNEMVLRIFFTVLGNFFLVVLDGLGGFLCADLCTSVKLFMTMSCYSNQILLTSKVRHTSYMAVKRN